MFSLVSIKVKSALLVIVAGLSLLWLVDSTAESSTAQVNNALPFVALQEGANLAVDADEASKKKVPVLLFFSMEHCPYCIEVEEDYLKPILRNSEYDSKVIIRKVKIDGADFVRDFKGKDREADEFSDDYNVTMVPTLILVNSKGKKIAPAIIGIKNSHYYSNELDEAIDVSLKKIREIAKR